MPWILRKGSEDIDFGLSSRRVHEDVLGAVNWARAGGGLFQIYHYIAADFVRQGQLVEVLKPFNGRTRPFSVLYPRNRHLSARVGAFVDFLAEQSMARKGRGRSQPAAT